MSRPRAITLPHFQHLPATPTAPQGTPAFWEQLRTTDTVYGIPASRLDWERLARGQQAIVERAAAVAEVVRERRVRRVVSYGVGTAGMEFLLLEQMPTLELVCTDYAPVAVERLRNVFPEAQHVVHDLATDAAIDADLHVLARVDSEFPDYVLGEIIRRFDAPVLFIPGEVLTDVARAELEWQTTTAGVFTGYRRTEARLRELWERTHRATRAAGGFLLERRARTPLAIRIRNRLR